jgi:FkbH-like protein
MATEPLLIISSFTAQPVKTGLAHWSTALGLEMAVSFAPAHQVFQQLLDPASYAGAHHGLTILMIRLEDIVSTSQAAGSADDLGAIDRGIEELRRATDVYASLDRQLLLMFCPSSPEFLQECGQLQLYEAEAQLSQHYRDGSHVAVIGSRHVLEQYPVSQYHDTVAYREGMVPYTAPMFAALAAVIARFLFARRYADQYKIVIADCDNTLWTGVCGEAGADGVVVDEGRRALQVELVKQAKLGRLVCLCSRNNEGDVWNVFEHHAGMFLQREHLASWRINWRPKHENLRALSEELNSTLESVIYLDDDAAVCSEIETLLPEVLTLQVPTDTRKVPAFLSHIWAFDKVVVTSDDRQRVLRYQQERVRREFESSYVSYQEFLQDLNVTVSIVAMERGEASRVAQLMIRTTQFNSGDFRLQEEELVLAVQQGRLHCSTVRVTDRFGDYGLVGYLLYYLEHSTVLFPAFALSCRVLGRGVEDRILDEMKQIVARVGCTQLEVIYKPTSRNMPVGEFLERTGFKRIGSDERSERFQYCGRRLSDNACASYQ